MNDAAVKPEPGNVEPSAREVLFFELEFIAVAGRAALFDVVKKTLKPAGIDLTPVLFARSGMPSRPGAAVRAVVDAADKEVANVDELAEQAEEAMRQFLQGKAALSKELPALIEAAAERNIEAVAISAWPEKTARALMEKLGLDKLDVDLEAFDSQDPVFPRADHWLRMLKQREQDTIPIIAVVSSRAACKGALTAGATCIALPDEYTAFEEFSGARMVLESLGEMPPAELLDLVSRR